MNWWRSKPTKPRPDLALVWCGGIMDVMKPKLGALVHYKTSTDEIRAATIVQVWDDSKFEGRGCVNLHVHTSGGDDEAPEFAERGPLALVTSVTRTGNRKPESGCWFWPRN